MTTKVPRITGIELTDDYILIAEFEDGAKKRMDFKPLLSDKRFSELLDIELFKDGFISPGGYAVIWTDNADMSEYELYQLGEVVK